MTKKISVLFIGTLLSLGAWTSIQMIAINTKGKTMSIAPGSTLPLSDFQKNDQTGIMYKITQPGSGPQATIGKPATVHYTGWILLDPDKVGPTFDSSHKRNQPFSFMVGAGQVIKGWDLMVAAMHVGEKRIVVLPPSMAYGSRGAGGVIAPNSTLIFEIELLKVS